MDEKQRYTFDIFVAFLTPVDTLTNSAMHHDWDDDQMHHDCDDDQIDYIPLKEWI